jgi:hypothetical protein
MTANAVLRVRGGPAPIAQTSDSLTHVELTWIEKRIENWIRFGQEVRDEVLDRRRRIFSYRPGSVFAFVRWAANDFGTTSSRIDIVRAVEPNEPYQTLPFVQPGGDILLKIEGWPKVEQVLAAIDEAHEREMTVVALTGGSGHAVHNRLAAGEAPRAYTQRRHRAFLLRRRIGA